MSVATKHYFREVESLLQDQDECVTVSRLATRLHVSRSEASRLLSNLYQQRPNAVGEMAIVSSLKSSCSAGNSKDETVSCTVFSLKTLKEKPNHGFLYALSPADTENEETAHVLPCAHEQVLAVWRDMIRNRDTGKLQDSVQAAQDVIMQSAYSSEEWAARWSQYQQPTTDLGSITVSRSVGTSTANTMMKKKAITAASFFGSAGAAGGKKSEVADMAAKKPPQPSMSAKPSASTTNQPTENSCVPGKPKKGISKHENVPEEKENKNKQQRSKLSNMENLTKAVGNADDFLGDADEDGDDSVVMEEPVTPSPMKRKKFTSMEAKSQMVAEEAMDVDRPDAGAKETEAVPPMNIEEEEPKRKEPGPKQRSRHKKLVEKTSMDANGYLHTETQEVWEEIPSDEDVPASKPKPMAKTKPAKAPKLKQGNLASFFKK